MGLTELLEFLRFLTENVGASYAILIFVIGAGLYYIHRQHSKHIKSKDEEIDRLNSLVNKLQDSLLGELKNLRKR